MKSCLFAVLILIQFASFAQVVDIEKLASAKRFVWTGSLAASTSIYNASGIENRSNPSSWNVNGSFNATVLETLDLPFSFSINRFQTTFSKPQLQFGISPKYKWSMLHLGHRNLTFNSYTLSGHTFLGAGFELNPKKWRIAAMYGRLRQAVEIDTNTNTVRIPAFKRKGYGFKLGYGTSSNFIDLIYFQAKDDSNSISSWKDPYLLQNDVDAALLKPAENRVVGVSALLTVFKKLTVQVDAGASLFNNNLSDAVATGNKKSLANESSTTLKWAGKASAGYNFGNLELRAGYERILPGYLTMGSYFFNDDLENITLAPSCILAKGKINFAGAVGLQRNNLANEKLETTKRFIGNGNISINPAQNWGIDMTYNNFGIRSIPAAVPINDSTRIRQVNQTIVLSPRYTIHSDSLFTQQLSLNLSMNDVNDRNVITKEYGNMQAKMVSMLYVQNFSKNAVSVNAGINYNDVEMAFVKNTQLGFTIGYSRTFLKEALNCSINNNFNLSKVNNKQDGTVLNSTGSLNYTMKNKHSFNFTVSMIKTTSKQFDNFTETMGSIGYNYQIR